MALLSSVVLGFLAVAVVSCGDEGSAPQKAAGTGTGGGSEMDASGSAGSDASAGRGGASGSGPVVDASSADTSETTSADADNVEAAADGGPEPDTGPQDAGPDPSVVPINWSSFAAGAPKDASTDILRKILLNSNKYGLTTWYKTVKQYAAQTDAYLTFGGVAENNIRPPAAESFGLATSIALGVYDPTWTGVSLADAKTITLKIIRSVAYRHKSNTSSGWGDAWQSAHWAAYAGQAAWLLWSEFSKTDQDYIRNMVVYEANRFNAVTPPVYQDRKGTIVSPGDTKGEENAWNAHCLQTVIAMMPHHENRPKWLHKCVEYMMSAYSRPSDLGKTTLVNGSTVDSWLVLGTNINDDGTLVNHKIIHPDYMQTVEMNLETVQIFTLAHMPVPQAALYNADVVYSALVDLKFKSPPYTAPGGTCYTVGSDALYYPQGNDWGTMRRMHMAALDVLAHVAGVDAHVSRKGDYWEPLHAQKVLDMQGRFTDGKTYGAAAEDTYPNREEWVAEAAGRAYLGIWVAAQNQTTVTNDAY